MAVLQLQVTIIAPSLTKLVLHRGAMNEEPSQNLWHQLVLLTVLTKTKFLAQFLSSMEITTKFSTMSFLEISGAP